MRLILASNSPRRRELLREAGIPFEIIPSRFEEKSLGRSPVETVEAFAFSKAQDVFGRNPDSAVLGADTVVALDGTVLGKPKDETDAKEMLFRLQGRSHSVLTGVCLLWGKKKLAGVCETKVNFFPLTRAQIEDYVRIYRPLDKAGSYGIQDGYPLVEHYEGSYTNIVGLPMEFVREYLREANLC